MTLKCSSRLRTQSWHLFQSDVQWLTLDYIKPLKKTAGQRFMSDIKTHSKELTEHQRICDNLQRCIGNNQWQNLNNCSLKREEKCWQFIVGSKLKVISNVNINSISVSSVYNSVCLIKAIQLKKCHVNIYFLLDTYMQLFLHQIELYCRV